MASSIVQMRWGAVPAWRSVQCGLEPLADAWCSSPPFIHLHPCWGAGNARLSPWISSTMCCAISVGCPAWVDHSKRQPQALAPPACRARCGGAPPNPAQPRPPRPSVHLACRLRTCADLLHRQHARSRHLPAAGPVAGWPLRVGAGCGLAVCRGARLCWRQSKAVSSAIAAAAIEMESAAPPRGGSCSRCCCSVCSPSLQRSSSATEAGVHTASQLPCLLCLLTQPPLTALDLASATISAATPQIVRGQAPDEPKQPLLQGRRVQDDRQEQVPRLVSGGWW